MLIGRRPEAVEGLEAAPPNGTPPPNAQPYALGRPTDVGWDPQGNIFISDGYTNSRVVKYDKFGKFIKSVGTRGAAPGQMNTPHSLQVDAKGNVYVADRGNARIQVFDSNLVLRAIYDHVGNPWTLCITPGPHQYSIRRTPIPTATPAAARDITGEVYKMELDGTVIGKFGKAGKQLKEFSTIHGMDCRNENELWVVGDHRVARAEDRPASVAGGASPPPRRQRGKGDDHETHTHDCIRRAARARCRPRDLGAAAGVRRRAAALPEIPFDSVPNFLKLPDKMYLGEVPGVATNSKGHVFVYTRTGTMTATLGGSRVFTHSGSRLFEFDEKGAYVREIGVGIYGFLFAHVVRVDPQDNIWVVDEAANLVMKFDPNGRILMTIGRKPESINVRNYEPPAPPAAPAGRGGARC